MQGFHSMTKKSNYVFLLNASDHPNDIYSKNILTDLVWYFVFQLKNTLRTLPQDHALTNQMKKNLKDELVRPFCIIAFFIIFTTRMMVLHIYQQFTAVKDP